MSKDQGPGSILEKMADSNQKVEGAWDSRICLSHRLGRTPGAEGFLGATANLYIYVYRLAALDRQHAAHRRSRELHLIQSLNPGFS